MVKFGSKIDADVLKQLRNYAKSEHKPISVVLTSAVREYLERVAVRPAFRRSSEKVMDTYMELFDRLSK